MWWKTVKKSLFTVHKTPVRVRIVFCYMKMLPLVALQISLIMPPPFVAYIDNLIWLRLWEPWSYNAIGIGPNSQKRNSGFAVTALDIAWNDYITARTANLEPFCKMIICIQTRKIKRKMSNEMHYSLLVTKTEIFIQHCYTKKKALLDPFWFNRVRKGSNLLH